MDLNIEITKLYALYAASKMLDHAVRRIGSRDTDWHPFSPSRFVYSYFTLNSIYGFDWHSSVDQGKALHWEPNAAGKYPTELEQLKSLISFIDGAMGDNAQQHFSQYLNDQLVAHLRIDLGGTHCMILSFPTIMVHVIAIATFDLAETRDTKDQSFVACVAGTPL